MCKKAPIRRCVPGLTGIPFATARHHGPDVHDHADDPISSPMDHSVYTLAPLIQAVNEGYCSRQSAARSFPLWVASSSYISRRGSTTRPSRYKRRASGWTLPMAAIHTWSESPTCSAWPMAMPKTQLLHSSVRIVSYCKQYKLWTQDVAITIKFRS